jgi:hypothetical protein
MKRGAHLTATVLGCAVITTLAAASIAEALGPIDVHVDIVDSDTVKVTWTDLDTNEIGWNVEADWCPDEFCERKESREVRDRRSGQPQSRGRTESATFNLEQPEDGEWCFRVTSELSPNGQSGGSGAECVQLPPECFPGDCRPCGSNTVQTCNASNAWNACHTGACP